MRKWRPRDRLGNPSAMRATAALAGLFLTTAALLGSAGCERAATPHPNVILISIDSLRADHVGSYGYARDTTPTIDRLAREGALFETAVSSTSWTLPAHAALFTGLYGRVHGAFDDTRWLDESRETLAERFRDAGYQTVGFFSGPYLHPHFGLGQGFDHYEDCTSYAAEVSARLEAGSLLDASRALDGNVMAQSHRDVTNPIVLAALRRWLPARSDRPLFLFVHLWDVHYDYVPPPPYDRLFDPDYQGSVDGQRILEALHRPETWSDRDAEHVVALYDGEIRATDATIDALLAALREQGLLDDAIVAVTADHGEAFYEHQRLGHRMSLHREELRIPLVVHAPGRVPAGRRIASPVSIVDVAPTLLELAGTPPLAHAMGHSLVPTMTGSEPRANDAITLAELRVPARRLHLFAIRSPMWKIIFDRGRGRDAYAVYDLRADPFEETPLGPAESPLPPDEVKRHYTQAIAALDAAEAPLPTPRARTAPVAPATEEQLRALGYLE